MTAPELDAITLRVERFARESTLGSPPWIEEFTKTVDAELVVYGFDAGTKRFYLHGSEELDEYEAEKTRIEARFPRRSKLQAIVDEGW